MSKFVFHKDIPNIGQISFRKFDLFYDIAAIHSWVTQPYAVYWGMNGFEMKQTIETHEELLSKSNYEIFIGEIDGNRVCMMERYKVASDMLADYYEVDEADYGMHILVAPKEKHIPHFTWHIFSSVMEFMFSHENTKRVVVEPDSNNAKIHALNRKAGFQYQKEIKLPHKTASLAWCTIEDYKNALDKLSDPILVNE